MSPARAKIIKAKPFDWLTILQFGLGGLGISLTWLLALALLVGGMLETAENRLPVLSGPSSIFPATGIFLLGLLLVPSTVFALRRLLGLRVTPFKVLGNRLGLIILLLPLLLGISSWAVQAGWDWLALITHLLFGLVLVAWLVWLAMRGVKVGSAQRTWGAFASGLAATPLLAFILEAVGVVALILVLSIYILFNPSLANAMVALQSAADQSPEQLMVSLTPFLSDPFIFFIILASLGFFVPVVEELLKPLGVYLLLGRKLTAAQGFALGALGGAGYALAENLTRIVAPENLLVVAIGRLGVTAMHIFTGALGGYAVVRARNEKRIGLWLGILALNTFIHGLWNAAVLLATAGSVTQSAGSGLVPVEFGVFAALLIPVIALACLIFMQRINRRLVKIPSH